MIDEEKFTYLFLLLDEPVYLLRPQLEPAPVAVPEIPDEVVPLKAVVEPVAKPAPVQVVAKPEPVPKPSPVKNRNKVLILFNNEQSPYLAKNEEVLLKKILHSIKLDIDDVDLVNYNNIQRVDYVDVLKEKILNQLISFGVSLTALNLQLYLKKYEVEQIEGVSMLLSDNLSELEHSPEKKKLLWKALQQMFM